MANKKLKTKNITKLAVPAVVVLLAILIPEQRVNAAGFWDFALGTTGLGALANGISSMILYFVGNALSAFAGLLDGFIRYQTDSGVYGISVVEQSWTQIRDFVNLFFILILIVMAFGTIFNLKNYTWQDMLPYFIVAALLINFSLTIGQYIITVANGLSGVFLNEIENAGGISNTFAQGFNLADIATSGSTNIIDAGASVLVTLIFGIIFTVVAMLAFEAAAIFSIVRLFMLWFLLIISPIAWLGYALPNFRGKTWGAWWNQFLGWCFWLPLFLFFVMFAVIFVKNQAEFPPIQGSEVAAGLTGNAIMLYGLSLGFLIGGMAMAKKVAWAGAKGASAIFGKIETGVRKYAPGAGYVRGAKEGLKERAEEIKEKGVRIPFTGSYRVGGAESAARAEARAKGWFGPAPTTGEREARKKEAEQIDTEFKRLRELNLSLEELNKRIESTKGSENVAALRLKAENGWFDTTDKKTVIDTIRNLGGAKTASGAAFVDSLQKGGFEKLFAGLEDKESFVKSADLNTPELIDLKKALLLDMANNREIFDKDLIKETLALFKTDSKDAQDKVKEALKKNMDNLTRGKTTTEKEALLDELGKMGADININTADLQRSFALSMAEDKEVTSEGVMTKILEMYENEPAEQKEKIEKALQENIQNLERGRKKEGRKAMLLDRNVDKRIKKMAANIMIDKKEVNDLSSEEAVLDLIGRDTARGREAYRKVRSINPLIEAEAKVRKELGKTDLSMELSVEDEARVLNELVTELNKISRDEFAKLKQMSGDFYKDPRFKEAIQRVLPSPDDMAALFRDAPRDLRDAIRDLPKSTRERRRREPRGGGPGPEEGPRVIPPTPEETRRFG